jgi:hypothetical protein
MGIAETLTAGDAVAVARQAANCRAAEAGRAANHQHQRNRKPIFAIAA